MHEKGSNKSSRFTKRLLSAAAAAAVSVSLAAQTTAFADDGAMREDLTAAQVSKEMGLGINLGNTMEAYWLDTNRKDSGAQVIGDNKPNDYETCWSAVPTTKEAIDGMKEAGFSTVRIPVYWGNMMAEDGTFTINDEYIARVKEIVDYCRDDGLYAVVNMHHYDEFIIRRYTAQDDLEGCAETVSNLWTQIADYFKDYSDFLVFEGFNEYLGGGPLKDPTDPNKGVNDLPQDKGYEWTNTLNQAFVDAVRATGSNNSERVLIASGYWTNIDLTTSDKFKMPQDTAKDKLMVSVHYVDNAIYWQNKIGGDEWRSYSIDQCEKLKKAFSDKGIPVFVGETTSSYPRSNFAKNADVTKSADALEYMLDLITDYGFTPVLWDTNNNFYNRTSGKINDADSANVIAKINAEKFGGALPDNDSSVSDGSEADSVTDSKELSSLDSVVGSALENTQSAKDSSSASSASSASSVQKNSAAASSQSSGGTSNPATGVAASAAVVALVAAAAVTTKRKR